MSYKFVFGFVKYAQFAFEFILGHMCHQVVVLEKSNIAQFAFELHFVIQEEIPLKRSQTI